MSYINRSKLGIGDRFNAGALFVLPTLFVVSFLILYPIVYNVWLGFHSYEGGVLVWVGLENYVEFYSTGRFFSIFQNTIVWGVLNIFFQIVIGTGIALLINTPFYGKRMVRGLLLLPWVTPGVVVAIVWKWMYDPTFGILNHLLSTIGLIQEPIAWLSRPDLALFAMVAAGVWKRFPFVLIMILAGLQDVDQQLHKAAIIDGAPLHDRIRHVTLPQLAPVLKVVFLLSMIWALNNFVILYVATGGGPIGATNIFPVALYKVGIGQMNLGQGSAIAVVTLLLSLAPIYLYLNVLSDDGDGEQQ